MERNLSDIDKLIEMLYKKECPSEKEIRQLCYRARDIFIEESNVERITTPVTVCGDIHGQFYDLLELFKEGGRCPDTNYIFLGDYVDRGYYSLETFLLLLSIKIKYPNKITLLRGNHESRQITQVYGFYDECNTKFGSSQVWRYCTETFDYLPVSALINNDIFCVHGGLSPAIISIDQIRLIDRKVEVPHEGALCDLMWSDPQDNLNQWKVSPRGAGFIFGENEVKEFNHRNNITTVCRAHQLVMEGYKYVYDNQLVTVWSAPNYCYRCGNVAAIMQIAEDSSATFKIFREAPEDRRTVPERTNLPNYFL